MGTTEELEKLEKLKKLGFKKVGKWKAGDQTKSEPYFEFEENQELSKGRVIYAFVVDNEIKYIGICESYNTTLKDRLGRYKSKAGGSTNERIYGLIKKCLEDKKEVLIFALAPDSSQFNYSEVEIDLVKGLENPLINEFSPEWNKQGTEKEIDKIFRKIDKIFDSVKYEIE